MADFESNQDFFERILEEMGGSFVPTKPESEAGVSFPMMLYRDSGAKSQSQAFGDPVVGTPILDTVVVLDEEELQSALALGFALHTSMRTL
jgi:hypothetical protein